MKKLLAAGLILALLGALIACKQSSPSDPAAEAKYTITFDANGGTGTMAAQTTVAGSGAALSANAYSLTNYNFAGWTTSVTSAGTSSADCAAYSGSEDVTLYAVWLDSDISFTSSGPAISVGYLTPSRQDAKGLFLDSSASPRLCVRKETEKSGSHQRRIPHAKSPRRKGAFS